MCQYVRTEHPGYSVVENQENFVDTVTIERLSPQTKPNCEARPAAHPTRMSASAQ